MPGHERKVFIPHTNMFQPRDGTPDHAEEAGHALIHGCLTKLDLQPKAARNGALPYGRGVASYRLLTEGSSCCRDPSNSNGQDDLTVRFDFLVYALGCHLPPPINVWSTASNTRVEAEADAAVTAAKEDAADQPPAKRDNATCCMSSLSLDSDRKSAGSTRSRAPCRGSKGEGVAWLCAAQTAIRKAKSVVIIGAGALGVQFASDIASLYGTEKYTPQTADADDANSCNSDVDRAAAKAAGPKKITLLCSRDRLLPRFSPWMHERSLEALENLGVSVLFKARADMDLESLNRETSQGQEKIIRTTDGREVTAELVLFCTGQQPCTEYLAKALPADCSSAVDAQSGMAKVNRYLQLAVPAATASEHSRSDVDDQERQSEPVSNALISNLFVVGDCADAFGALNAGHTAWEQANIATNNIVALVSDLEEAGQQPGSVATMLDSTDSAASSTSSSDSNGSTSSDSLASSSSSSPASNSTALKTYVPPLPGIKVSLGFDHAVVQHHGVHEEKRGKQDGCKIDLNSDIMWTSRGFSSGGAHGDWRE